MLIRIQTSLIKGIIKWNLLCSRYVGWSMVHQHQLRLFVSTNTNGVIVYRCVLEIIRSARKAIL